MSDNTELASADNRDLADDMVFEPSDQFPGRKVAVAIKDGLQVCWCCFDTVQHQSFFDAMMGDALVKICSDPECRRAVGRNNHVRERKLHDGEIILLDSLTDEDREKLMGEISLRKKQLEN